MSKDAIGFALSAFDLCLKFGFSLLLMPFLVVKLPEGEIALFYFISSLLAMAYLVEGGVNRVLVRWVAANRFKESNNIINSVMSNRISIPTIDIPSFYRTTHYLYLGLAFFASIIFIIISYKLSGNILEKIPYYKNIHYDLVILSLFVFVYIFQLRYVGLMHGNREYNKQKYYEVLGGVVRLLLSIQLIYLDIGASGIFTSYLFSVLLTFFLYRRYYEKHYLIKTTAKISGANIKKLCKSSLNQALVSIGAYFIYHSGALVISQSDKVGAIASYMISFHLFMALLAVTTVPTSLYYARAAEFIENQDKTKYKKLLFYNHLFTSGLFLCGLIMIVYFGDWFFKLLGTDVRLLPSYLLLLMGVTYFFEANQVVQAAFYSASNHLPFVIPAIIAGGLLLSMGIVFYGSYGFLGLILLQLTIQIVINLWIPFMLNYKLIKKMNKNCEYKA